MFFWYKQSFHEGLENCWGLRDIQTIENGENYVTRNLAEYPSVINVKRDKTDLITTLSMRKAGEELRNQKATLHCNSSSIMTKHLQTI
jgi:hypothetical protein